MCWTGVKHVFGKSSVNECSCQLLGDLRKVCPTKTFCFIHMLYCNVRYVLQSIKTTLIYWSQSQQCTKFFHKIPQLQKNTKIKHNKTDFNNITTINSYNFLKVKLQGHTTAEYAAFRRHFSVGLTYNSICTLNMYQLRSLKK